MHWRAVLSLAFVLSAVPLFGQPLLSFHEAEVVASQVTPGAKMALFAISHDPTPYQRRISTHASVLADDDRDGVARYRTDVATASVWIAVDVASGRIAVASPAPEPVRRTTEPLAPGQLRKIARAHEYLAWLLVRPGSGAWTLTIEDSGLEDDDFADDGRVTLALARMQAIGDSPSAPHELRAGDVVVAVDPETLAVLDLRLGQ
jgi:hypothetical protein